MHIDLYELDIDCGLYNFLRKSGEISYAIVGLHWLNVYSQKKHVHWFLFDAL